MSVTDFCRRPRACWRLCVVASLAVACSVLISACAGALAYREGNALLADGQLEQGFAKLQEAVDHEPRNVEYKLGLAEKKSAVMAKLFSQAENHRRSGRHDDAIRTYRAILRLDTANHMAEDGIAKTETERRHDAVIAASEREMANPANFANVAARIRGVLTENPRHRGALALKSRLDMARKQSGTSARLAQAFRKPITLEYRGAPIRAVFDSLSQVAGLNFIFDSEVRGDLRATISVRDSTVEEVMRLVLMTNQLEHKVIDEGTVLIYPATSGKLKEYQPLLVRAFYLNNADVKGVSSTLRTIAKVKDLVVDERLGLIIVRDTPETIAIAERLVVLQDQSDPEVMLEVEILEIKRSRLLELGVKWPNQLTLTPMALGNLGLTVDDLRSLSGSRIQASISGVSVNARKEDQDGLVLANPKIRVRNREKAKIVVGDRVPVVTTTSSATGFVSESVNYLDVGLKLEVEPNIYLDEEVGIKVNLEVSSLVREIPSKTGSLLYQIGSRGASTVLRLRDGETQVLAGLISDEERRSANKIPALGELPLVGRLFGSHKDDNQRSEILLSITPRILRAIQRVDLADAEFEAGVESGAAGRVGAATAVTTPGVALPSTAVPPTAGSAPGALHVSPMRTPNMTVPAGNAPLPSSPARPPNAGVVPSVPQPPASSPAAPERTRRALPDSAS